MWQKCPICDGEGKITSNGATTSVHQICPTCNGARIISELNGLPPNHSIELPSDEEIEEAAIKIVNEHCDSQSGDLTVEVECFEAGVYWIKKQILNQNK